MSSDTIQSRAEQSRAEQSRAEQSRRNVYLDCLRGLASIAVILFHYTTRYEMLFGHKDAYLATFPNGWQAVALFFILSGYFGVSHMNNTTALQYGINRFFRMYPSYWVAILITFPLTKFLLPSRAIPFRDAVVNLTMAQGFLGVDNVDGAYWTLQYELLFFIIIGVILFLKLNKYIDKLCVAWVAAKILLILLPDTLIINYARKIFNLVLMGNGYGHMFISGAVIRCIELRLLCARKAKKSIAWILVLGSCLLGCVWIQFYIYGTTYGLVFVVFLTLVAGSIALNRKDISISTNKLICLKPVLFVAKISYPLYLVHQNVGYIIIQNMEQIGLTSEIWIIAPILMMIGVAYLINRFVEKHCAKISNRICNAILS